MTVLPFRLTPESPYAKFRLKVRLTKGDHAWYYEIKPLGCEGCQTWVRYDGQPHRAQLTESRFTVTQIYGQYLREIARLEADGWVRE